MKNDCYVYLYKETNKPDDPGFYVGKGHGYRKNAHLKPSAWKHPEKTSNPFLYYKIKSMMESGKKPYIVILAENISDHEAYNIENAYINKHGRRFVDGGILFNISDFKGGSYHGYKRPEWSEESIKSFRDACKALRVYDPTYQELYDEFVIKGKTRQQIAEQNNCSASLVKKRLQELGIAGKKSKEVRYPPKKKWICKYCNKEFLTPNCIKIRLFCSIGCRTNDKKRSTRDSAQEHERRKDN